MDSFLFAYGTLQPGKAPPEIRAALKSMRAIGKASAKGNVFDLGEYPGAIFRNGSSGRVWGTVFELPRDSVQRDKLFAAMDEYEGVDRNERRRSLFLRRQLPVSLSGGRRITCWVYEYTGQPPAERAILDGHYVGARKNRRTPLQQQKSRRAS